MSGHTCNDAVWAIAALNFASMQCHAVHQRAILHPICHPTQLGAVGANMALLLMPNAFHSRRCCGVNDTGLAATLHAPVKPATTMSAVHTTTACARQLIARAEEARLVQAVLLPNAFV